MIAEAGRVDRLQRLEVKMVVEKGKNAGGKGLPSGRRESDTATGW
jgi:hypothetical protein